MTHDPGLPPVVRAKLTQPRALPSRVRPATLDHACTALSGRLTLVCAPGGYGKTTLALEALRKTNLPAAWYRVDELDRDPVVFLASVTEAIAARVPAFGALIRDRLRSASQGQVSTTQLAAIFVNDLAENLSAPLNLVIDDYHEAIDSPGFNSTLEYLMAAAPEVLRFVVLSRYEPAFAVSKMQLAGEVTRFGVEQLRLTGRETRLLVKDRGGVVLDEASSERLAQLTQGWPASIDLAAMTLQWMDFPSIEAAVSDPRLKRDVYGYLTEQVYSREKPTTRAFLLDTCCLEYVTPELADDVAGRQDGHAQLEHLTGNQVFTARAEDEKTCRYHPLLRDFLRQRFLQERGAGAYHTLQVRSAQAMERAGDLPSAIAIYLSANEGQEALDVIARADFGTLEDIRSDTLQAWLSRLPSALSVHPWAMVLQAHLLMRSGKYEESVGCASGALTAFEQTEDRAGRYQALCVKECALFWKGDNEGAREASQSALDVAQTAEERIHALISLAAACEGQCRWDEALESLESASSLAGQTSRGEGFRVASHRATISYLTGRLRDAATQFEQATRIEKDGSSLGLRVAVMNAHGLTFMGLGLYQNAASKFDSGVQIARAQGYDFYAAMLASSVSQLKLANGIADSALNLASFATTSGLLDEDAFCLSYAYSHLGTIHRRTGDLERASNAYQRAVEVADGGASTHALLNASANLAFTRFREAQRSCRRELHEARSGATEKGLLFLAAKASFYLAVADYSQGEHQRAFEGLEQWATQAIHFGHLGFMSQELVLLPDVTAHFLSQESDDHLCSSVIAALALSPSALPLFMSLLDTDERLAMLSLSAADGLPSEGRNRFLRRAARHRDASVRRLAARLRKASPLDARDQQLPGLTSRETEVLRLISEGLDNDDIASTLFIAPSTVKTHVNRIFVKLGTSSRINAARAYHASREALFEESSWRPGYVQPQVDSSEPDDG